MSAVRDVLTSLDFKIENKDKWLCLINNKIVSTNMDDKLSMRIALEDIRSYVNKAQDNKDFEKESQ